MTKIWQKRFSLLAFIVIWMTSSALAGNPTANPFNVTITDLRNALLQLTALTTPLSHDDTLNTRIPFVGASVNELVGGSELKSIATLLDFSNFVSSYNVTLPKATRFHVDSVPC